MIELVQGALAARGIEDELEAVGQFNPRGHTGGLFVGGLTGSDAGGLLGGAAGEAIGLGAGSLAGMRANDAASGLPASMLIGVSATTVYGLAAKTRHSEPTAILFQLPRTQLDVEVHQRVNVRVLELIDEASGSRIELEGNRLPVTHSKDVIDHLQG
jgi:mannose/fructose/N-acetylgalactosamine-specific phosphotransferase system component IIC